MLEGKSILVTGATGSFGRKFVEIVLQNYKPRRIIVFSRDELKQFEMRQTFPGGPATPMRYFIGDVRDAKRLVRAFNGVDVVVHAAALKQVPVCEYNPFEAIKTNILGTKNVIDAAIVNGVERVMHISTDKAVNPINLYGATKLCAEKMLIQANTYSATGSGGTKFSVCRYGNVIGSRGSVVPLFKKQKATGKITVTDERMTRFWVTLEQGVRFVLNSMAIMQGGEVFIPKIPSTSIMALAKAVAPGCEVETIGIRVGEKLHEVLLSSDEARTALEVEDFYVIPPDFVWWKQDKVGKAKKLPEGFKYTSDTDGPKLSADDLLKLIDQ
ncbi:MAG: UDP-N-acetylglucosamine 4,6-dehydratase (inverting) [Desulfarculaceae bacterium]|jgi:UDP-N-acetylglucosamine 4,6-dehydratase